MVVARVSPPVFEWGLRQAARVAQKGYWFSLLRFDPSGVGGIALTVVPVRRFHLRLIILSPFGEHARRYR
jgi:hypothetical protein